MKISTQLRFLVFLLGTATICACTNPDGTTMTEGSGKDNGYLAMPSHIEKDSIIDPDTPGTIFKLNVTDPYAFRSACLKKRGTTAYYIAMEFDGDIPAGTTFNGEIPAINHQFAYTFPADCAQNRAFWFLLPQNYQAGQEITIRTHQTNITALKSHADGLIVIANIDAGEGYVRSIAIPSQSITTALNPKKK